MEAQSGIRMVPARLNARCAMVATECVATGADWMAGDDDPGADDDGASAIVKVLKRGGENRHPSQAGRFLAGSGLHNDPCDEPRRVSIRGGRRNDRCPSRVRRCVAASLSDDGGQLSHVSWLGSPGGNREPAGLIVVWQMCYPVQHVLDSTASMASSATLWGILLRAVSGCCYNNGGLRNRRWANAITKHDGKGGCQTSVQSLTSTIGRH